MRTAELRSSAPDCHSSSSGEGRSREDCENKTKIVLALANRLALRPAEVAEALGISERTVRQILPELPHLRIGSAVVVPIEPLREWLRERAEREPSAIDRAVEEVLDGFNS